jgi:hypothetical protein
MGERDPEDVETQGEGEVDAGTGVVDGGRERHILLITKCSPLEILEYDGAYVNRLSGLLVPLSM